MSKTDKFIFLVLIGAISYLYYLQFPSFFDYEKCKTQLNEFGDFVGGTLNLVLSFFALVLLFKTYSMQRKELKLQRDELRANRDEFQKTTKAHENNVKLSVLMVVLQDDQKKIMANQATIIEHIKIMEIFDAGAYIEDSIIEGSHNQNKKAREDNLVLNERLKFIKSEIEKILCESGVTLPQMPSID
ncbi:hypothetical protein ABXJ76_12840 [Methylobacter sp. G7]|uniref:hypothetical protein n=1 Tax=Methylobacter sp. G7 TaxID=3230117 RepID=UPI003D80501F